MVAEGQLRRIAAVVGGSNRRIQLDAYAGDTEESVGDARRLSLSRVLTVRSYLIQQGIPSTDIDVRALGIAGDAGLPERVDVLLEPI